MYREDCEAAYSFEVFLGTALLISRIWQDLFSNVPVSVRRLGRCEAVVAPAQMRDLWGRGRVYSGKSPLSDNSSRI